MKFFNPVPVSFLTGLSVLASFSVFAIFKLFFSEFQSLFSKILCFLKKYIFLCFLLLLVQRIIRALSSSDSTLKPTLFMAPIYKLIRKNSVNICVIITTRKTTKNLQHYSKRRARTSVANETIRIFIMASFFCFLWRFTVSQEFSVFESFWKKLKSRKKIFSFLFWKKRFVKAWRV